jgi:hypothetical protein
MFLELNMSDISDLLERFRRGPEVLAMVLTGVFGEEEDFVPAPGKWSIRQIIAHLADSELGLRAPHAPDRRGRPPHFDRLRPGGLDQEPGLRAAQAQAVARKFPAVRAENYELLKELPEAAYARTGNHSERGAITLRDQLELLAQHAESHARQMQAIREEYKKAKGKK